VGYPGSKGQAGVFHRIIGQMPPHSVYVEPFFGSGVVFWNKQSANLSIVVDRVPGILAKAGDAPGVRAIYGDALVILPTLGPLLGRDTLVYCDPPYLLQTRRGRRYYDHELSDEDHVNLLALLKTFACHVMISGYRSALYDAEVLNWRRIDYRTRTHGKTVTECLWCNFPEPGHLHDWRYAGQSFRERLSLKRLAARWLARLEAMPPRKRGFILSAVHQRYPQQGRASSPLVDSGDVRRSSAP
jgi:hypothetical protein